MRIAINVLDTHYVVSTVELFIPLNGERYETMVFPCDNNGNVTDYHDVDCHRYETESAARDGHAVVCAAWGKVVS